MKQPLELLLDRLDSKGAAEAMSNGFFPPRQVKGMKQEIS